MMIAQQVEDLSPDGGDHPNPEYPWESDGLIVLPTEHPLAGLDMQCPKMIKLIQLVDDCLKIA